MRRVGARSVCAGVSQAVCKIPILPTARSWRGLGSLRSWLLYFLDKRVWIRKLLTPSHNRSESDCEFVVLFSLAFVIVLGTLTIRIGIGLGCRILLETGQIWIGIVWLCRNGHTLTA